MSTQFWFESPVPEVAAVRFGVLSARRRRVAVRDDGAAWLYRVGRFVAAITPEQKVLILSGRPSPAWDREVPLRSQDVGFRNDAADLLSIAAEAGLINNEQIAAHNAAIKSSQAKRERHRQAISAAAAMRRLDLPVPAAVRRILEGHPRRVRRRG